MSAGVSGSRAEGVAVAAVAVWVCSGHLRKLHPLWSLTHPLSLHQKAAKHPRSHLQSQRQLRASLLPSARRQHRCAMACGTRSRTTRSWLA